MNPDVVQQFVFKHVEQLLPCYLVHYERRDRVRKKHRSLTFLYMGFSVDKSGFKHNNNNSQIFRYSYGPRDPHLEALLLLLEVGLVGAEQEEEEGLHLALVAVVLPPDSFSNLHKPHRQCRHWEVITKKRHTTEYIDVTLLF